MSKNPTGPDVVGEELTEMDQFWLDAARTAVKESRSALEEAAKELLKMVTLMTGAYFAAISFSDLQQGIAVHNAYAWMSVMIFVSPIILWCLCLFFAMRVFIPETYKMNLSSPCLAEQFHRDMINYKHRNLIRALRALLVGFALMLFAVTSYLWQMNSPA